MAKNIISLIRRNKWRKKNVLNFLSYLLEYTIFLYQILSNLLLKLCGNINKRRVNVLIIINENLFIDSFSFHNFQIYLRRFN